MNAPLFPTITPVSMTAARHQFAPYIQEGFLSVGECEALQANFPVEALSSGRLAGGVDNELIRTAATGWFDLEDMPWLDKKLVRALAIMTRDIFPFDVVGFDEGFQMLRYEGGPVRGHYDWHSDVAIGGVASTRKLTLLIQLSDPADYHGGALEVNYGGDSEILPVAQGALIAIPSFVLHRVASVTDGVRYSMAAWVHGPAFR